MYMCPPFQPTKAFSFVFSLTTLRAIFFNCCAYSTYMICIYSVRHAIDIIIRYKADSSESPALSPSSPFVSSSRPPKSQLGFVSWLKEQLGTGTEDGASDRMPLPNYPSGAGGKGLVRAEEAPSAARWGLLSPLPPPPSSSFGVSYSRHPPLLRLLVWPQRLPSNEEGVSKGATEILEWKLLSWWERRGGGEEGRGRAAIVGVTKGSSRMLGVSGLVLSRDTPYDAAA